MWSKIRRPRKAFFINCMEFFHFQSSHTYLAVTFWIPALRSSRVHALSLTLTSTEPSVSIFPDDAKRFSRSSPRHNFSLCSESRGFYIIIEKKEKKTVKLVITELLSTILVIVVSRCTFWSANGRSHLM